MPRNCDPNDSLRTYVTSPAMAFGYDRHHEDTALLAFDTAFLREVLPREGLVLDVGCGTGRHLVALSEGARRMVGMDLSPYMLDVSAAKLAAASRRVPLLRADMRAPLPFADDSFDAVICMFSTIGLIPSSAERLAFVREVKRILKPGGVFALHVHNRLYNLFSNWGRAWLARTYVYDRIFTNLEIGDRVMPDYCGIKDMFLHVFCRREVCDLLASAGLDLRRMIFLDEERTADLTGPLRSLRANGFLLAASKPSYPPCPHQSP